MAKKLTLPTGKKPASVVVPTHKKLVDIADYDALITTCRALVDKNNELKEDLGKMIGALMNPVLSALLGNEGVSMMSLMNVLKHKDKLAEQLHPMMEVLKKYTTEAPAPTTAQLHG